MYSNPHRPVPSAGRVNIKDQLAATHDPLFPFSSPNIDDHSSYRSSRTGHTFQRDRLFTSSPTESSWTGVESESESESDRKKLDSRLYQSSITTWNNPIDQPSGRPMGIQKKRKPGLQVVTDFSKPSIRTGNIVFNQVAAKQPKHGRNRARSIISQRGVKVMPSPLNPKRSTNGLPNFRSLVNSRREKRSGAKESTAMPPGTSSTARKSSPNRSSVVFGLCVPKDEAPYLQHCHGDILESAVTLVTPLTPQIVVTPAEEEPRPFFTQEKKDTDSPTSVYSRSASQFYAQVLKRDVTSSPPPPPPIPAQYSSSFGFRHERSPIPKQPTQAGVVQTAGADVESKRRASSESKDQILPDSCDTARPKSQGWWNLMLSPMLSRAGTLKIIGSKRDNSIPPVPPVPNDPEKVIQVGTPETEFSPETPRRLGLAGAPVRVWSRYSHWEREREVLDEHNDQLENPVPAIPRDCLEQTHATSAPLNTDTHYGEGLAAEYYHACAIEQLAGINYFDCVNHSCAERLPKLHSIFDMQRNGIVSAGPLGIGGEFQGASGSFVEDLRHKEVEKDKSSASPKSENIQNLASKDKSDAATDKSDLVTLMETEADVDEFVSPNVRQASTATFSRSKTVQSREPTPAPVITSDRPAEKGIDTRNAMIDPQKSMVESPGPISPDATRAIAPAGAVPLAPIDTLSGNDTQPTVTTTQTDHILMPPPPPPAASQQFIYYPTQQGVSHQIMVPTSQSHYFHPQQPALHVPNPRLSEPQSGSSASLAERSRAQTGNDANGIVKNASGDNETKGEKKPNRRKFMFGDICCVGQSRKEESKRKRQYICITIILILVIVLCIILAMTLRRRDIATPIESQWLNLTGYPPVPTGISTVARPNLAASQNGCVQPNTLWSCSLSKEDQPSISPNDPDQPNFRFQIRFRNGTVPANMTIPLHLHKRADDPSADDLFVPNPTPPDQLDQIFLGSTTDNVTQPFDGETTPFFITFMSSSLQDMANATRKLRTRQTSGNDALNSIPVPDIGSDGSAAPASLLPTTPFPISQPVKLYNRGLKDEHYGFYTYYDKSIFLSGITLQNGSAVQGSLADSPADQNGGSTKGAARVRCTWAQTRFIVKIYTNSAFGASILPSLSTNVTSAQQSHNETSSATDFTRPGSFPYPITIELDRHGGTINKKITYCYGMQTNGDIDSNEKILVSEIRSAGGTIINASPLLLNGNSSFNSSLGGIDGGTGGCGCTWQNWT